MNRMKGNNRPADEIEFFLVLMFLKVRPLKRQVNGGYEFN